METVKEILVVYGRIITILPLLLVVTLFMGKRSIGEMPVFDFLIIITLGAVVGADIADPKIEHLHTAVMGGRDCPIAKTRFKSHDQIPNAGTSNYI